ncbi:MAG TPA: alkaline phosphatase D family protein [Acidimicrobiia bacterium]|nr:alkaline phosphatase D family protein [Acidimicrobiia bacterium]
MTPNERLEFSRRRFLAAVGGLLGAAMLPRVPRLPGAWAAPLVQAEGSVFTLGVASGEPRPDGVVLWTRLAPEPLAVGGGMPPVAVPVRFEVAADDAFRQVVHIGMAMAEPDHAHSVHLDITGLEPGRWYWYRFATATETSPVGRTRTAPGVGTSPSELRFAFASCQQYEHGYYTAYRHMAEEDLEFVVHLGDYIYESGADAYKLPGGNVRHHVGPETTTLDGYRQRLAQYKIDPDLQAAHAAFPWVVTWDDHEVDNNYAGDISQDNDPPQTFRARRAAAYQAYWEHMPLPPAWAGQGAGMRFYRRFAFGRLAEVNVLDTRSYRTDQPCGDRPASDCPERTAPTQTITGPEQEAWLLDGLGRSAAQWNVLAQQVFMAQLDLLPGPARGFDVDAWDGYVASRDRLMAFLAGHPTLNPVVLTGDFHSNWVADLKADFDDPNSATVGTEFVGTSITSGGDGSDTTLVGRTALAENGHLRFSNSQRGYVRCALTLARWTADFRVVPYVRQQGAPISTRASFTVEAGRPGAQLGSG